MPHSLAFLLSVEAAEGRRQRGCSYREDKTGDLSDLAYVAHVELPGGWFEEMDAEDASHARAHAMSWLRHFGAVSVAVRRVFDDGKVGKPVCIYDWRDTPEGEAAEDAGVYG